MLERATLPGRACVAASNCYAQEHITAYEIKPYLNLSPTRLYLGTLGSTKAVLSIRSILRIGERGLLGTRMLRALVDCRILFVKLW